MKSRFSWEEIQAVIPWTPAMLVLAALIVQIGTAFQSPREHVGVMWRAVSYALEHPYLDRDARLMRIMAAMPGGFGPIRTLEAGSDTALEQARLDQFVDEAEIAFGSMPARIFGLSPSTGFWPKALTYPIYHHSWFAMVVHAFLLLACGLALEKRFGPWIMGAFSLSAAVLGALVYLIFTDLYGPPMVGAGSLAAAFVAAHFILCREQKFSLLRIPIPFWLVLGIWLAFTQVANLLRDDAQLWGLQPVGPCLVTAIAAGFLAWFAKTRQWKRPARVPGHGKRPMDRAQVLARVDRCLRLSQTDAALNLLAQAHQEQPRDVEIHQRYFDQLVRSQKTRTLPSVGKNLIRAWLNRDELESAFFCWQELQTQVPGRHLSPQDLLDLSLGLIRNQATHQARAILSGSLPHLSKNLALSTIYELITAASYASPNLGVRYVDYFLNNPRLHSTDKKALQAMRESMVSQTPAEASSSEEPREAIELIPASHPFEHMDVADNPFTCSAIQRLRVVPIVFQSMDPKTLHVQGNQQAHAIPLQAIKAVSVGIISELGADPFVLIDLFAEHPIQNHQVHRAFRLRSDGFPRQPQHHSDSPIPESWIRQWLEQLLPRSQATAFPDTVDLRSPDTWIRTRSISDFECETYGVSS